MAEVSTIVEGIKGIKDLYKWWKRRKGEFWKVRIKEEEKIVRIKEVPEMFGGQYLLIQDIITGDHTLLDIREIKPIKKLTEKEAERIAYKKIDIMKAVNFIKKLTQEDGGVLSHEGSIALPSPSAQSLLALYELNKIYPEKNILPKEELEKRIKWLANLDEWRDWEGHKFNCFAASTTLWALSATFESISEELKPKVLQTIKELSLKIIDNFDKKEKGWSWSIEVKPTYPFFTFFALKSLKEAKKFLPQEIVGRIENLEIEAIEELRKYLKSDGDYGNLAMALWTIYEISGERIKEEEILAKIYEGVEKMKSIPLHTKPTEFHIHIMVPTVIIPMVKIAPESVYTIKAVKKFLSWMRETQEEGWRWVHVSKDSSWVTAQVLLAYTTIVKTAEVLQEIILP